MLIKIINVWFWPKRRNGTTFILPGGERCRFVGWHYLTSPLARFLALGLRRWRLQRFL